MKTLETCVGRWAVVLFLGQQMVGTVVDFYPGEPDKPKRIRIQRGSMQGIVLQPYEYEFKDWLEDKDVDE
jgi:hypothetical protein